MKTSRAGLELIMRYEGFSATLYRCPAGLLTIGYGHVVLPHEIFASAISKDDAVQLLQLDVVIAERAVMRFIDAPLTQSQYDALVSFTFNVGAGALQRSTLRQVVNRAAHRDAPAQFMRWVRAGGRVLAGLVARRHDEAKLYIS